MNPRALLGLTPWIALATAVACSGGQSSVGSSTPGGTGSSAAASAGGTSGAANAGTSGLDAESGVASGPMSAGSSGDSGFGATSGQNGGATSGAAIGSGSESGGGSETGPVAAEGGGSSGASGVTIGSGASSGSVGTHGRSGTKSAGCGLLPTLDTAAKFTDHSISISACAACTPPNCPSDCIAPPWVPGGVSAQTAADGEDFLNRDFTVKLPSNYQPGTAYPVFYGGNGCGVPPPQTGAGYGIGETGAIEVGLQYVGTCFADGGTSCAGTVANEPLCVNGPEVPYFKAVMAWIESHYCVDLGNEFIGGGSSGAWEAFTVGCGVADALRGFISVAGGKREHRWPCTGPIAAFMIVADDDTNNPVGPLATINTELDSYGSAPGRDEVLMRNGCTGTTSSPYDPKYPECVKYTGCPAAYPVVWCEFPSGGHDNTKYDNVDYAGAMWPFLTGLPPAP